MSIKRHVILCLQVLVILFGITVFGLMLWEPHLEGRNTHATLYQIYFNDPFLAYVYTASLSFFTGLYYLFKLFGYIRQNQWMSQASVKTLRAITYCTITLILFIVGAEAYFILIQRNKEDNAGGIMIGLFLIIISASTGGIATFFERKGPGV